VANIRDRESKGEAGSLLYVVGVRNPAARLSESDVRAIRSRRRQGDSARTIAAEFGVSVSSIRLIDVASRGAT